MIRSLLRASKFSVLKLIVIVIFGFITPSLLASVYDVCPFWASLFNFLNYNVLVRITDEGSILEIHIWSILLIKTALKWCIEVSFYISNEHLSIASKPFGLFFALLVDCC